MSLYKELQEYDKQLAIWSKAKALSNSLSNRVAIARIVSIWNKYNNNEFDCPNCTTKYMNKISKYYIDKKEHYLKRRKGF